MAMPIPEVTPIVKAESASQVDSSHKWPPKGCTIYILTLSIDPLSSDEHPHLIEYLFDQDTVTFFHPSTICTSHLSRSSLQASKREGIAALIAECHRDSIPDEPASPQSWLLSEEAPIKLPILFPSSPKGAPCPSISHHSSSS